MKDKVMICNLGTKEDVESVFVVKYIQIAKAKDGKSYLNIILSDASGDLEARMWNEADQIIQEIFKGDIIELKGKMNFFQGRKQLIIASLQKKDPATCDLSLLTATSSVDSLEMFNDLMKIVDNLEDVYIKKLLQNILADNEIARRLKKWPAGKTIHHAYEGGLLEHILSCANLSVYLSKYYQANTSYVVAGAILHDLCKIYELSDGLAVDYTEEGKLVGHLVKSLEIIDRFSYPIKNFPYQMKLHLKHIMLSHHGEYEYGSPKIPSTKEAYLLHLIDYMDSKMASIKEVQKSDTTTGHWSSFVKHMDRTIFKAELPTYSSFIEEEASPAVSNTKGSLGKLLKDFKIQED